MSNIEALSLIAARYYPWTNVALSLIGATVAVSFLTRALVILVQTFILSGKSLKYYGAKKGAWAVVTGATDGIGREFALQLAKSGFNIFMASRSEAKLQQLASELRAMGVESQYYAIDFAERDIEKSWQRLFAALSPLDIGVLVNNVGKSHDMPVDFVETTDREMSDILEINIHTTLKITKSVLPGMLSRKRGLILNISSFAGSSPSPMLATYSGSKAFLQTWSQALAKEVESKGVTVSLINTFFVVSAMSKIRKPSLLAPTPKAYVRSVLSKIGLPCGYLGMPYASIPYWSHSLFGALINNVITYMPIHLAYTHNLHKDIRRRALKKRERETALSKQE